MSEVAIVTGAVRGLGSKIALFLAGEGYTVVVHYKESGKEALSILSKIKQNSPHSIVVSGDLSSEKDVSKMFGDIFKKFGQVDLLVNNVGNFVYKKLKDTTNREFRDVIESNIYSTLFCSRAVLPTMRKQKSGSIINIGAAGAERFILRERVVPYFMAKNGVYILTKAMAAEEAKYGIHINLVSPTSMKVDIFKKSEFPMGREAKYSDVVSAIKFLLSEDAYYINGANIEVSGGFIAGAK